MFFFFRGFEFSSCLLQCRCPYIIGCQTSSSRSHLDSINRIRQVYCSAMECRMSLPSIFLCWKILQYFGGMAIFPLVMGHKNAPAFIAIKPRVMGVYSYSPNTREIACRQNVILQESRNKSYDRAMKGIGKDSKSSSAKARSGDSFSELSAISSSLRFSEPYARDKNYYKVFCDMDGCLVNFEKGVRTLLKESSSNLEKRDMWEGISQEPLWFERLEWQMDGKRLWSAIKHLQPDILTGVPDIESSRYVVKNYFFLPATGDFNSDSLIFLIHSISDLFRVEKFNWCKR